MSAYIVSRKHINTLGDRGGLTTERIFFVLQDVVVVQFEDEGDLQAMAEMLLKQNIISVSYLYKTDQPDDEKIKYKNLLLDYSAIDILRICECYDYQACETPDYESTYAASIIRAIRTAAILSLPEWDKSKVWCI